MITQEKFSAYVKVKYPNISLAVVGRPTLFEYQELRCVLCGKHAIAPVFPLTIATLARSLPCTCHEAEDKAQSTVVPFIIRVPGCTASGLIVRQWIEDGMQGYPNIPRRHPRGIVAVVDRETAKMLRHQDIFVDVEAYSNICLPYRGEFGTMKGIVWVCEDDGPCA